MKLYRIIFPVDDIQAATSFYQDIFTQHGQRVSTGRHYFNLKGVILVCYDPIADGDEIHQKWKFHENQYIYIATDDLESVHHKFLVSKTVKFVDEEIKQMPWGERLFYAVDPFGNPICFVDEKTIFTGL